MTGRDRAGGHRDRAGGPAEDRDQADKPAGDRDQADKPAGDRDQADGPAGDRDQADGPAGDRDQAGGPADGRDRAGGPARDRDPSGRARNARPRDELGRPLPRSAPSPQDVPRIPDDLAVTPAEAAELGGRLLAEGRPFHAHEVFEAAWKSTAGPERELWRGLAQIAVGLTHARRGNPSGASALLRRGAGHVREHAPGERGAGEVGAGVAGVDPAYVAARAADIAARIDSEGLAAVPESDLRIALRQA